MKSARKRILIADCHEDVLIVLESLFEDAGFDTTTVWSSKEALMLIDLHTFDLVLVSEYLPDGGCEMVLHALQRKNAPYIVIQTRAPTATDFARFGALGAKDVIHKHRFPEVVETVSEWLTCDGKRVAIAAA